MRKILRRLYPAVVVPPIPEKHSLADYAKMQSKAKDDQHTIDLRKRMLQSFLNRVATHEVLSSEHLFHRFLEPGAWVCCIHEGFPVTMMMILPGGRSLLSEDLQEG